jgi:sulfur-oxidizing protein SoxZ
MESTIRMRATLVGETTDVQVLVQHPMDSGFAKDPTDKPIPPYFIEELNFEYNGKTVFVANWGPMIAKDPYVRFSFTGGKRGGEVRASWIDSRGLADSTLETIQ